MDMFETASREAYRYPSVRGYINTEQLWDLPLTAKGGFSLDEVAKGVNDLLKASTTESFVTTAASNPAKAELETKLEIVKHVIAIRLAENEAARSAAAKKAEKAKLLDILGRKQDAALEDLSVEELTARANAL